jgi:hypothetical protein
MILHIEWTYGLLWSLGLVCTEKGLRRACLRVVGESCVVKRVVVGDERSKEEQISRHEHGIYYNRPLRPRHALERSRVAHVDLPSYHAIHECGHGLSAEYSNIYELVSRANEGFLIVPWTSIAHLERVWSHDGCSCVRGC